jgi:hypothetical protein
VPATAARRITSSACSTRSRAAAEDYTTWINEADAMIKSGLAERTLRRRFRELQDCGLARHNARGDREYRACAVPPRPNIQNARSRGTGGGMSQRKKIEVFGKKGRRNYVRVVREPVAGVSKVRVLWKEPHRQVESFEDTRNGLREARAFAEGVHDRLTAPPRPR